MSSALRDVLCACYESGGTDETTGVQLAPKLQVRIFLVLQRYHVLHLRLRYRAKKHLVRK